MSRRTRFSRLALGEGCHPLGGCWRRAFSGNWDYNDTGLRVVTVQRWVAVAVAGFGRRRWRLLGVRWDRGRCFTGRRQGGSRGFITYKK